MLSYPFTSQVSYDDEGLPKYDRAVDSKFLRKVFAKYFSDGVFFKPTNSLQVSADTGMQVVVAPGTCHIQGAIGIEETSRTLVVQAAEGQDRIDTVVARLDLSLAVRSIDLYVLKGTAGESPQPPALTRDSTIWEIGLANLFISKNSQTISQQRITDTRLDTDRCGQVAQAPGDFDTAPYFAQLQAAIDQYNSDTAAQLAEIQKKAEAQLADQAADLASWFGIKETEFTGWFETIKGKLGEDPAGSLQNQIEDLNAAVTGYPLALTANTNSLQITAKKNSIENAKITGFTQQAGTGDPSHANVRAISTAGIKMVEAVFDGSADENWQKSTGVSGNAYYIPVSNALMKGLVFASYAEFVENSVLFSSTSWAVSNGGSYNYIRLSAPISDLSSFKQYLQNNPITVWYTPVDESQATGLYVPKIAQGHEYRCEMMELTAFLCAGDTVESCVLSGCDVKVVLDGTESFSLAASPSNVFQAYNILQNSENFTVICNDYKPGGNSWNNMPDKSVLNSSNILGFRDSEFATVEEFKAMLAARYAAGNPVIVWYRSTAYTAANDVPVQLETHQKVLQALTGKENWIYNSDAGWVYLSAFLGQYKAGSAAICSHYAYGEEIPSNNQFGITSGKSLIIHDTANCGSAEAAKAYLAAQYAAGTPVTVEHELSTPAVYAHDPAHMSNEDGVTTISTQEGCTLELYLSKNEAKTYAATLLMDSWKNADGVYTQTAEVKCLEGMGFVSAESVFDSPVWTNQTEDLATNETLTEALGIVNTGYITLGGGTVTCKVAEKPTADIEILFKAKR